MLELDVPGVFLAHRHCPESRQKRLVRTPSTVMGYARLAAAQCLRFLPLCHLMPLGHRGFVFIWCTLSGRSGLWFDGPRLQRLLVDFADDDAGCCDGSGEKDFTPHGVLLLGCWVSGFGWASRPHTLLA